MIDGPSPSNERGVLLMNGVVSVVNPAYRVGAQQTEKLRVVEDIMSGCANSDTPKRTPINLPSSGHRAHMCSFFRFEGDGRTLAMTKADHDEVCKQFPLAGEDEQAALATLKSPTDNNWYGFAPKTQLFGSAAAVLHYTCSPSVNAGFFLISSPRTPKRIREGGCA